MDEIERIKSDIVEIKLEIKPLEKLPDKLDELIRLQQEFIHILTQNYTSEKSCEERRDAVGIRIEKLESIIGYIVKGLATITFSAFVYLLAQVVIHK